MEELGHPVSYLADDQIAVWASYAEPLHEEWIKENEAKRRPFYEEVQQLIVKYS